MEEPRSKIKRLVETHLASPRREQTLKLLESLPEFFTSPASSRSEYHGCFEGGLILHTLRVVEISLQLGDILGVRDKSSILICALFHDLGKILAYEKTPGGYKKVKTLLPHSAGSLFLLQDRGLKLSSEEWQAILMHNGLYTPMGEEIKNQETPLTLILHWADMWASHIEEKTKPNGLQGVPGQKPGPEETVRPSTGDSRDEMGLKG